MRLHDWVDRPNLYVKIPATEPGPRRRSRRCIAARQVDQRHADLLARALRGGRWRRTSAGSSGSSQAAATRRRCARSRASSSRASTPRPTSGSTRSAARRRSCKGKLAIANAKLAYRHWQEVFAGPRWEALAGEGRDEAALPLGVDVDEEPRVPRRHVRRGADRAGDGEHDAGGDDRRVPGSRRGRG